MNRSTAMKWLVAAVSAVVVASLLGAVFVIGSPMEQRKLRLDNRRLEDIQDIARSIQYFANNSNNALPPDLQALNEEEAISRRVPTDPDTNMPYKYKMLNAQSYQLCAVFLLPSPDNHRPLRSDYDWRRPHAAGEQCFKYTIKVQ